MSKAAAEFGPEGSRPRLDVFGCDESARLTVEVGERGELLALVELDRDHVAVGVLRDEEEVEDPDRVRIDELGEGRRDGEPLNWLSGNPTTMYSSGPMVMLLLLGVHPSK